MRCSSIERHDLLVDAGPGIDSSVDDIAGFIPLSQSWTDVDFLVLVWSFKLDLQAVPSDDDGKSIAAVDVPWRRLSWRKNHPLDQQVWLVGNDLNRHQNLRYATTVIAARDFFATFGEPTVE